MNNSNTVDVTLELAMMSNKLKAINTLLRMFFDKNDGNEGIIDLICSATLDMANVLDEYSNSAAFIHEV